MKRRVNNWIKSYNKFTQAVYAPHKGLQRVGVCFCNVVLALYITAVIIFHNFAIVVPRFRVAAFCGIALFCFTYQGIKYILLKHGNFSISCNAKRSKLSWKVFAVSSTIVFFVYIVDLFAHYPGGISPDNIAQWNQVQSGLFNDWHPAIHTMIIWLVTRILPSYSFFVGFQIACFSMLCGYMAATLVAWGIKKGWIIIFLITIISTQSTHGILLYAWKDTALTIFLLCLSVYIINIFLSKGEWLSKWYNAVAIAILSALVSIVRHNGFFFTIPLAILGMIFYRKKTRNVFFSMVASLLVVLGISNIVYPLVGVEYTQTQTYVESVGVPMTILSGVMVRSPEKLDAQTKAFLNGIADDEEWKSAYKFGNYNSVKWKFSTSPYVSEVPPKELLSMTFRTIKNAPKESLLEAIALTRMVWDPFDWGCNVGISVNGDAKDVIPFEEEASVLETVIEKGSALYDESINATIRLLTPYRMLTSIGLHMLFLLMAGVYSINRNDKGRALFLFFQNIIYNLGTMLLLCGPDYRFFHFNTVITLPLILVLLSKNDPSKGQNLVIAGQ